jgi:hypothetical protein
MGQVGGVIEKFAAADLQLNSFLDELLDLVSQTRHS